MPPMPEIIADLLDPSCYHLLFRMESGYLNDLVLIPLGLARATREPSPASSKTAGFSA
jgi:hypothetical protein